MQSPRYLLTCALKSVARTGQACPSCGGPPATTVDRKWLVTALRRCSGCGLLYRTPTTSVAENERIYQEEYHEGFTTDLPTDTQLAGLLRDGFAGHEKDYAAYLAVLAALGVPAGARVLDFGCSWGYGSHQLQKAGYAVDACEISRPRAAYAREKLGVNVQDITALPAGYYDVFFSAHVIEHVPSVREMLATGLDRLRPGGLFVAFTPNQSGARRVRDPAGWHRQWGFVHPQLLDETFLSRLSQRFLLGTTSPHDADLLRGWPGTTRVIAAMAGNELLLVIRKED